MEKVGIFALGFISGAATIIAIEGVRGLIIRKKQAMVDRLNENEDKNEPEIEVKTASPEFWKAVSEEAAKKDKEDEEKMLKEKYVEKAKRYHKSIKDMSEEELQNWFFEEGDSLEDDEDQVEEVKDDIKKDKVVDDAEAYFIEGEDAGYEYDVLDCVFCADGTLVDAQTELPINIADTFKDDIRIDDIMKRFTLVNYDLIYIRDDRNGTDYGIEWTDKSYKEAFGE